ncbi:MAG: pantoate--beta-alanine ligase, partial [Candidatus Eremiobacteraeota bacterium]|nr:pantoate--beta-alanine ligase [Candidatus Eremiobacteraeota bacterium]
MKVVLSIAQAREQIRALPRPVGFVPTMGALHAGHVQVVERARERNASVVVSIFVNPLQFGPSEDLARYPRDLEGDRRKLEQAGVDVLFAPDETTIYPSGFSTTVDVGVLG